MKGFASGHVTAVGHVSYAQEPSGHGTLVDGGLEVGNEGHESSVVAQLASKHLTGASNGQVVPRGHWTRDAAHACPVLVTGQVMRPCDGQVDDAMLAQEVRQVPSVQRNEPVGQVISVGQPNNVIF